MWGAVEQQSATRREQQLPHSSALNASRSSTAVEVSFSLVAAWCCWMRCSCRLSPLRMLPLDSDHHDFAMLPSMRACSLLLALCLLCRIYMVCVEHSSTVFRCFMDVLSTKISMITKPRENPKEFDDFMLWIFSMFCDHGYLCLQNVHETSKNC